MANDVVRFVSNAKFLYVVGILLLWFLSYNYNPVLAFSYAIIGFLALIIFWNEKIPTIYIERFPNRLKSFAVAFVGLLVFFVLSNIVLSVLGLVKTSFSLGSMIGLYAEAVPYFAQNLFVSILVFVFIIPFFESDGLFGQVYMFLTKYFRVSPFSWTNKKVLGIVALLISFFIFIHLTAKSLTTNMTEQLIMIGLLALVSIVMIMITKQTVEAILMHVFANGLGILVRFDLLPSGEMISTWVIVLFGSVAFIYLWLTKALKINRIGVGT